MVNGRCAACKYLRRRCPSDCIFSPYFPSNNPQRFEYVHRIYGASNVAKMLEQLPSSLRPQAAETLCYEAESRIQDPVYGCAAIVFQLQQQLHNTECELAKTRAEIAVIRSNGHLQQSDVQLMSADQVHQQDRFGSSFKLSSYNWFI